MTSNYLKNTLKSCEIASFQQSARCPVVSQPFLAALSSELGAGAGEKRNKFLIAKMIK